MMEINFKVTSGSVSDRGLSERRPQNEDSYLDVPQIGLFAVADGVGGANAGEVASQMAVEILAEAFSSLRSGGDAEDMMRAAIEQANTAIFQMSADIPQLATMATTVVALHISGNIATIGHVGDSRLYRVDEKGNLYRETRDHSVVEEEVRAGRLTPEEAERHPSRNVISRALGAEASVEMDLKTIMFGQGTSFLLCSDGITRHITDLEISQLLTSPLEPDEICQTMKSLCFERGAEDNLTAVVIRCGNRPSGMGLELEDFEEMTVASPREEEPAPVAIPVSREEPPVFEEAEAPALDLGLSSLSGQLSYSIEEQDKQLAEVGIDTEWDGQAAQAAPTQPEPEPASNGVIRTKRSADELDLLVYQGSGSGSSRSRSSGGGGTILIPFVMLVIGAAIGATAFYFAQQALPKPPEVPQPLSQVQTTNIPLESFEKSRRNVDNNPEAFIKNMEGGVAQTAEDYYLLARAYAHRNQIDLAVKNLSEARKLLKEQLKGAPTEEQKTLASEIALLGAVVFDSKSLQNFQEGGATLLGQGGVSANMSGNANTNTKSASNTKASNSANSSNSNKKVK